MTQTPEKQHHTPRRRIDYILLDTFAYRAGSPKFSPPGRNGNFDRQNSHIAMNSGQLQVDEIK